MKCPMDGDTLLVTVRAGIEIDFCPTCRGVWLDRGELAKIFEREAAAYGGMLAAVAPDVERDWSESDARPVHYDGEGDNEDGHDRRSNKKNPPRKRYKDKSWKRRSRKSRNVQSFLKDLLEMDLDLDFD